MAVDVLRQVRTQNPIRDQLWGGRSDSNTQEGDDVWVFQASPRHGLFIEILAGSIGREQPLDPNLRTTKSSFVDVAVIPPDGRVATNL